jgi:hypothetical protein
LLARIIHHHHTFYLLFLKKHQVHHLNCTILEDTTNFMNWNFDSTGYVCILPPFNSTSHNKYYIDKLSINIFFKLPKIKTNFITKFLLYMFLFHLHNAISFQTIISNSPARALPTKTPTHFIVLLFVVVLKNKTKKKGKRRKKENKRTVH